MESLLQAEPKKEWKPFVRLDQHHTLNVVIRNVCGIFLLPLRVLAILALTTWYRLILGMGMIGVNNFTDPTSPWRRRWFIEAGQPLCRLLFVFLGFYKIDTFGSKSMDSGNGQANVIVMNHVSWLDILLMMAVSDKLPGFVAKVETKNIPYVGVNSQAWQCLYVDNRLGNNGAGVAQLISERAKQSNMPPIVCFPEGTTTNGQYLITFRSGAFVGGHPVKPCALRYPFQSFSPSWETIQGVTPTILTTRHCEVTRLLSQFSNKAEVHWLPVYYPSPEEKNDPKLYASNVRKLIASELKVPIVESSFADKAAYHEHLGFKKPAQKKVD